MSRILVADDDAVQLDLRSTALEIAGHQVDLAMSVASALRLLSTRPADLLIMDLRFPNAGGKPDADEGISLIRRIRELGSAIPIIVVSGWPESLLGRPEEQMISRILTKPVKTPALLAAIRELVA